MSSDGPADGAPDATVSRQADGTAVKNDAGTCQICGESLEDPITVCPSCQTPHHQDCWEYAGGCSTFACPGALRTKSVDPQAARAFRGVRVRRRYRVDADVADVVERVRSRRLQPIFTYFRWSLWEFLGGLTLLSTVAFLGWLIGTGSEQVVRSSISHLFQIAGACVLLAIVIWEIRQRTRGE